MDPLRTRKDVENAMIAAVDWSVLIQVRDPMTPLAELDQAVRDAIDEASQRLSRNSPPKRGPR
jgi:hypothetical protein